MQTTQSRLNSPSPMQILEMANDFWISKTLFTGLELGIFETLASGPISCEGVAIHLDLPVESLQRLLTALASLGLVERIGEGWGNTLLTQTWLVRSSPKYLGGLFGHFSSDLYPLWRYLPEAVRENSARWQEAFGPQASHNPFETMYADPIRLKKFLQTMDALVQLYVPDLLQNYDFSPFHHWMDVGGALGTLPISVLQHYPQLTAVMVDLPPVKPLAEENVAKLAMAERIQVVAADFFKDDLPAGADLITLSLILHDWDDPECRIILKRCFEALEPGGSLLILEKALNDERTGPLFPALMNLNMLVATGGRERTMGEYAALLTDVGFIDPGIKVLNDTRDVVYARKT